MFDKKLGQEWTGKVYKIELRRNAIPFALPKCYKKILQKEVKCLYKIYLLKCAYCSEWDVPSTFIIPKKDQHFCFILEFPELNK